MKVSRVVQLPSKHHVVTELSAFVDVHICQWRYCVTVSPEDPCSPYVTRGVNIVSICEPPSAAELVLSPSHTRTPLPAVTARARGERHGFGLQRLHEVRYTCHSSQSSRMMSEKHGGQSLGGCLQNKLAFPAFCVDRVRRGAPTQRFPAAWYSSRLASSRVLPSAALPSALTMTRAMFAEVHQICLTR